MSDNIIKLNQELIHTELNVFCKYNFPKIADKNGKSCISILEKDAGCPAGLHRHCGNSTADMSLS